MLSPTSALAAVLSLFVLQSLHQFRFQADSSLIALCFIIKYLHQRIVSSNDPTQSYYVFTLSCNEFLEKSMNCL